MKICGLSGTNFGAKLLAKADIKKYNDDVNGYSNTSASFVELNPNNFNDIKSVLNAVDVWKYDLYGMNIAYSMERLSCATEPEHSDKFFAITTQKDNFEKLNPDNIEAIAHIYETNKRVEVVHLQVDPDLVYTLGNPHYKHVGKGMIDCLKDIYKDRSLTLISSSTATKFYEKQGFEHVKDSENRLTWNKEAEDNVEYKNEYW